MASLHRDPRGKSPFFYAAFSLPDGRRAFRSTKQTNRAKAAEVARGWEKAAKMAKAGSLTEGQARRVLDDILENAGQGRMNLQSVEEFFNGWIASKSASRAQGTVRRYQDVVTPFLKALEPSRRRAPLDSLKPQDILVFRDNLLRDGLANKSANLALKTLRAAFNAARRQGLITHNPAEAVEILPDDSAERGTFTLEELQALLAIADDEWKGMILMGYATGLRLGDVVKRPWSEVNLSGSVPMVRLQPGKHVRGKAKRKPLEIPILPELEEYLRRRQPFGGGGDGPIFPRLSKKKNTGDDGLSNTFSDLIRLAGIPNEVVGPKRGPRGRAVFRLSFHSLRHTFTSLLANAGVPRETRMKLTGHTSAVHDRYTHLEAETLREAMKCVPNIL